MDIPPEAVHLAYLIGAGVATKPVLKFLETISPAFGRVYRPVEIVIEAKAQVKANKIKALGDLEIEEALEKRHSEIAQTQIERASDRKKFTENRRQANLEDIFQKVPEHLPETVSEEKVDEDWVFQFIENSQDISNEQMKILWAKIFAGEVAQPNTYSLQTLATLKILSKKDAELFEKIAQAAIIQGSIGFILGADKNADFLQNEFGITYSNIMTLRELGLLSPSTLGFHLPVLDEPYELICTYGDTCIILKRTSGKPKKILSVEFFSKVGSELLPLLDIQPSIKYVQHFASHFKNENTVVKYGKILSRKNNTLEIADLREVN